MTNGAARLAKRSDREAFLGMVREYLAGMLEFGGDVLPTPRTMRAYGRLFDHSFDQRPDGVVVVDQAARRGFSIAHWMPVPFETIHGRCAQSLGAYVRPEHRRTGLGKALRDLMHRRLAELGFQTVLLGIYNGNEAALAAARFEGVRFYMVGGARPLTEEINPCRG